MLLRKKAENLELSLIEISRNPLVELADELSGEADVRKKDEGDAGPFIGHLAEFLQDKEHALIGGLGVRAYVRERPTFDFDVMISPGHWTEMRKFLSRHGAEASGSVEQTYMYSFPDFKMGLDVRLAKSPLDQEAIQNTIARPFKKWKLQVVKADYLAAMKVKAYSERKEQPQGEQDKRDVLRLLAGKHARTSAVQSILKKHRPDLLPELEEILKAR